MISSCVRTLGLGSVYGLGSVGACEGELCHSRPSEQRLCECCLRALAYTRGERVTSPREQVTGSGWGHGVRWLLTFGPHVQRS